MKDENEAIQKEMMQRELEMMQAEGEPHFAG